ncbi:type II toxin-antitoxin system HipA family toxin [Sphingomonas paeninsulae]|uniref:Type II toxin-antitoxin system HipA family toxin n=1 Tax=Sphingomonas paeninsulae TaxID=2319844 RepID=A0A494TDV9_SPHPE|nr:type II toxin-antitoxin system HipA family toxin [Sphingomonas paeninsulae]AYJ87420.1 type II toxin-antitoxin system HipA family toxin [Sphingomonas paeninsulae]
MARKSVNTPLTIYLNNRLVGRLTKQSSGAIDFTYDPTWLAWDNALQISLSLPLREARFIGAPVVAVFDNLLPDSRAIRARVAERVGAQGTDAFSLLSEIGRDCIGALQFMPDGIEPDATGPVHGTPVNDGEIEAILTNLARAPLGLDTDDDFRISVAGAQEKTALLRHGGFWIKPSGTTPTTHLFKPQIGQLPNGIDLSNSVENEFYCIQLMTAFGLQANEVEIQTFGATKTLVIRRFDRLATRDGRILRLPQEDMCQALSVPPTNKYENDGGPGIKGIIELLRGSDDPQGDQLAFFKSQIIFWLIGATDGHAKNFSVFLTPGGRFRLTPFYDVLTAQPSLDGGQIRRNQMKLAMAVGNSRKYRIFDVHGRHFSETGKAAGMPNQLVNQAISEIEQTAAGAFDKVETMLSADFPQAIHASVKTAAMARLTQLDTR